MEAFSLRAVVQDDVETAGHGDDELMQIFVGMTAALGASRHVVKVINALNLERYIPATLDKREIASGIADSGEVDDLALSQTHVLSSSTLPCAPAGT